MKSLGILTGSILITTAAWSQHKMTGQVLYNNGDTALYTNVYVKELDLNTDTDAEGFFTLENVAYGDYSIKVQPMGGEEQSFKIVFKAGMPTLTLKLKDISKEDLEGTTISGKTEKKEIETKGFAVNVIETQQAALQSIQTNELLDRSAGVRIRQDGGLGSHIHYNINGLTGNAVKIFIDGVPIGNYGNAFSLNSIPPALIERIEVYKGVVPAHLSEDALGGAINVILKQQNRNALTTSYSFGSFNTHQWNINGMYRNAKSGLTINGSAFYNYSDNNYKVWGPDVFATDAMGKTTPIEAKRFHDAYKSIGGKFDIGFTKVKWADNFSIGAVIAQQDKEVQHGTIMRIVYGNRTTNQQSTVFSANYAKRNLWIKGLDVNLNGSYSLLSRGVVDTVGDMYSWDGSIIKFNGNPIQWRTGAEQGNPTLAIDKENNLVARANVSYGFNRNNRIFFNGFVNTFDRASEDAMKPQAEQQLDDTRNLVKKVMGITYEHMAFNQRLKTNVFYKTFAQSNELIQPKWSGAVGNSELNMDTVYASVQSSGYGISLSYKITHQAYILASAEKAIRMPNAGELFGNAAENITATSSLRPEHSNNFNLGFNVGPFVKNGHSISLNTNFFYRLTNDMIRLNTIDDLSETNEYTNFESIQSYGFDAELNYNIRNRFRVLFTISKFYSQWNVEYNERGERYPQYGSQLANEPDFKFNFNVSYNIPHFIQHKSLLTIYGNVFYVDEFLRNWATFGGRNISVIPTQFTQDVGINYMFPNRKVILGLDAKNITNQQVFDNWALQKPGRGFYAKLTYNIL